MGRRKSTSSLKYCPKHNVEQIFYCNPCRRNMCVVCYIEDHNHQREFSDSNPDGSVSELQSVLADLDRNKKEVTEEVTNFFENIREVLNREERKVKNAISQQTALQKKRIEKEIQTSQQAKSFGGKGTRKRSAAATRVTLPWVRPTFVSEGDPSELVLGRVMLEYQGNNTGDGWYSEYDLDSNEMFLEDSIEDVKSEVQSYTRERYTPYAFRDDDTMDAFKTKVEHSWTMKKPLASITASKGEETFTVAAGHSIAKYDSEGRKVQTIFDNLRELPTCMDFTEVRGEQCLMQFYKGRGCVEYSNINITDDENLSETEDSDEEDYENENQPMKLPNICPCIPSFQMVGTTLFYQKSRIKMEITKDKKSPQRKQKSALIGVVDMTKKPPQILGDIDSGMKMVRNFHCFNTSQRELNIVVANKDLIPRRSNRRGAASVTSQLHALRSFDRQGRQQWSISRHQLHTSSDFRYDLRSIASDERHLFVLDYSVGAVHMISHGGSYLQRIVQNLNRPTHLCVDSVRQRLIVAEDRRQVSVYKWHANEAAKMREDDEQD